MNKVFVIGRDALPSYVRLDAGEKLEWTLVALGSCRLDLEVDLCGEDAELDLAGLYVCGADEKVTLNITVRHEAGHCVSRQLFKGLAGGRSHAEFGGLVYVRRDAQKTRAFQTSHNILLSREAVVQTCPQLEIYADDVECSHGATTGYLNEDELFYMRSRGVPESEARKMQMISFLAPVMARLPEELRNEVYANLS